MKRFALILATTFIVGCAAPQPKKPAPQVPLPQETAPVSNIDPCATRLHDIAGTFLLYYAVHHQLPQRVEQLQQMAGPNDAMEFVCPDTLEPYIYNPQGLSIGSSRVVLFDATPAHNGVRWAISINQPKANAPLIAEVVAIPESRFAAASNKK